LSGLRATDDFAVHNPACLRGELERVPVQAVWIFKDRAREQDRPTISRLRWLGFAGREPGTSSLDTATKVNVMSDIPKTSDRIDLLADRLETRGKAIELATSRDAQFAADLVIAAEILRDIAPLMQIVDEMQGRKQIR
jgi:hypothetical protein